MRSLALGLEHKRPTRCLEMHEHPKTPKGGVNTMCYTDHCHRRGAFPLLLILPGVFGGLLLLLLLIMRIIFRLCAASVDFPVALFFKKCRLVGIAPTALNLSSVLLATSLSSPPKTAALSILLSIDVHICLVEAELFRGTYRVMS